ncbi:MAG: hypothetical protein ACRCYT_05370 [Cetobacterium sp.]
MKNSSIFKIYFLAFCIFIFTSCSAILTTIGNNKINNSINSYYSNGITPNGTLNLIAGLDLSPDSLIGINHYKKQYSEISELKNLILKKKVFLLQDINDLNLYLLTVEEFKKISLKLPTVKIDYNDYNFSKIIIKKIFEDFIYKNETKYFNRSQSIQNILYYKSLNNYINSSILQSIILNLENKVTINLYVSSSFRGFSKLEYLVTNSFLKVADYNFNRNLGDYIIFKGYSDFISPNSNNSFIDFNFSNIYTRTIETNIEKNGENTIFIAKKRITLTGFYNIYSPNNSVTKKYFEFSENYTLKVKKYDESIFYDDERDILKDILEDKFNNIIRHDLNEFL